MTGSDIGVEKRLGEVLRTKGWMMGTAESCTGGHIAALITSVSGSSDYFSGGVVSYSNEVKEMVLGVPAEMLRKHGAVSKPVVEQMALGAVRILRCNCSVATSGVAGPTGGTPEKPVGTVWIATAVGEEVVAVLCHFSGNRQEIVQQATIMALRLLMGRL